jgi:hypothetical protein
MMQMHGERVAAEWDKAISLQLEALMLHVRLQSTELDMPGPTSKRWRHLLQRFDARCKRREMIVRQIEFDRAHDD